MPLRKRGIGAIEDVESDELVEAHHAVEFSLHGRRESLRKGKVEAVIGPPPHRKNDRLGAGRERAVPVRGEDGHPVAAPGKRARETQAVSLQSTFRKEANDSAGDIHDGDAPQASAAGARCGSVHAAGRADSLSIDGPFDRVPPAAPEANRLQD
jgi:hypothetical protein